jgi:hypothetical protein
VMDFMTGSHYTFQKYLCKGKRVGYNCGYR